MLQNNALSYSLIALHPAYSGIGLDYLCVTWIGSNLILIVVICSNFIWSAFFRAVTRIDFHIASPCFALEDLEAFMLR